MTTQSGDGLASGLPTRRGSASSSSGGSFPAGRAKPPALISPTVLSGGGAGAANPLVPPPRGLTAPSSSPLVGAAEVVDPADVELARAAGRRLALALRDGSASGRPPIVALDYDGTFTASRGASSCVIGGQLFDRHEAPVVDKALWTAFVQALIDNGVEVKVISQRTGGCAAIPDPRTIHTHMSRELPGLFDGAYAGRIEILGRERWVPQGWDAVPTSGAWRDSSKAAWLRTNFPGQPLFLIDDSHNSFGRDRSMPGFSAEGGDIDPARDRANAATLSIRQVIAFVHRLDEAALRDACRVPFHLHLLPNRVATGDLGVRQLLEGAAPADAADGAAAAAAVGTRTSPLGSTGDAAFASPRHTSPLILLGSGGGGGIASSPGSPTRVVTSSPVVPLAIAASPTAASAPPPLSSAAADAATGRVFPTRGSPVSTAAITALPTATSAPPPPLSPVAGAATGPVPFWKQFVCGCCC